jgi:acetyl/propionyl-CoA carboxylase alpha subunit
VWRQTWFGARLSDDALIAALSPGASARDAQHGIEEVTRRFDENAVGMDRWARLLVESSRRAEDPVRVAAAWAMHFDPGREEFVVRLRELVARDESVLVCRNAACALAKSGDAEARTVLRSMLGAFTVTAADAGVVSGLVAVGIPVRENAPAARIRRDDGSDADVIAPVPGRVLTRVVAEGARVTPGDPIVVLGPDGRHALNAAAALAIVGTQEDVELLNLASAPQSAFGADVKAVAQQALEAIRARGK